MLKRFLKYYKPHKTMFILDMAASLLISLIGICYPIVSREMLNDFIPNQNIQMIVVFGSVLLVLYIFRTFLRYFVQYYGHVMGVKMQAHMRSDMFNHLQKLPYKYYDNQETGKIMSRMTNDLQEVTELAHHGPENILICSVMIVGSFIYLLTINVILTLIIFFCVPFLILVSASLRKSMKTAFKETRKDIASVNAALESSVSGIRVTKAFTNDQKESEKFEVGNKQFVKSRSKAYKAMGKFSSSTSFITDVFNVVILISGGIFMYNGAITFGDYTAFIISINLFIAPVTTLIAFVEQYQNGTTGFLRFLEIMDEPAEDDCGKEILSDVKGNISFKNINFNYNEEATVLSNVNLEIEAGTKVALVGPSGGGKSTICHLLPKFYNINSGEILIDNKNIDEITLKSLRDNIGIVQQDVFLFNGSIKENIIYGKLNSTDEEIIEAAKMANIHDHIMNLPEGYDTQIGERGVRLSGGQKQRLSIARVFLKNPSILVLDEATSALDNTTEIHIQEALDRLAVNRTTLVVAHRLSTIKNADKIVVISEGNIQEEGTHDYLMENGKVYKDLYNLQFRYKA